MQLLPEWAPNIHPLLVHFPIAFLALAVLSDLAALIYKKFSWLSPVAILLYSFGTIGAIVTYFSGREAADSIDIPLNAYTAVGEHADLALITVLFFSVFTIIRIFLKYKNMDSGMFVSVLLFLAGFGGFFLVFETAEHGAELVYRYGLGVTDSENNDAEAASENEEIINADSQGSWSWLAKENAELVFQQNFKAIAGEYENLTLAVENDALVIISDSEQFFMFTHGAVNTNLVLSAEVNLSQFSGRFFLVHHVGDNNYDFVAIDGKQIRLGEKADGDVDILDSGEFTADSWLSLRAVSADGHYRGYVNGELIVHGHGNELAAGTAGIALSGKGKILFRSMVLEAIPEEKDTENEHSDGGDNGGHQH